MVPETAVRVHFARCRGPLCLLSGSTLLAVRVHFARCRVHFACCPGPLCLLSGSTLLAVGVQYCQLLPCDLTHIYSRHGARALLSCSRGGWRRGLYSKGGREAVREGGRRWGLIAIEGRGSTGSSRGYLASPWGAPRG
jgi:hypothetical protein